MTQRMRKPKAGPAPRETTPKAQPPARPAAGRPAAARSPDSPLIDERIRSLADWRGATLARVRELILQADPEITESVKWRKPSQAMSGVPVWSHNGILCTGETYRTAVKLTFARGASLPDPSGLFNASLTGGTRRAIDIHEGETLDAGPFQELVRAAVARNRPTRTTTRTATNTDRPARRLSGGNPQIARGDGAAPVRAYIAAMPGWKRAIGERLDAIIAGNVPEVRRAVRWNSPFYGVDDQGWFLSFHVFTRYVKVSFLRGTSLRPMPPGGTERSRETRWLDIHEGDALDEAQLASWIQQAAALPGWTP